jgi:branched-chain amino acid transport system permease protein
VTTALAAVFGLLVGNTKGSYFLMITMALGMILWGLACRWSAVTGGDNGVAGIPRPDIGLPVSMDDPAAFYYLALCFFGICFFLMYILVNSPFGQTLKGIRESESRMRALGYNIWLHKYLGYVVSAFFASIPGVLWAYCNSFIGINDVAMTGSMELFLMVILGGPGTLIGPAIGAGIIVLLKNVMSAYTQRWLLVVGIIYVLTILYAPNGFVNLYREWAGRRKKKTAAEDA